MRARVRAQPFRTVERLLADYVTAEQKRRDEGDGRLDAAISAWNDFDEKYGSFADEHSDL